MSRPPVYLIDDVKATSDMLKMQDGVGVEFFCDFMARALYDPVDGYYAQVPSQVGRGGDFFTSVSVGPVFGMVVAARIVEWWRGSGMPERWRVIEPGPYDGSLARDVCGAVKVLCESAFAGMEYVTVDPMPVPRAVQEKNLLGVARCVGSAAEVGEALPSFLIANEVLDALPCRVVEKRNGVWMELCVRGGVEVFVEADVVPDLLGDVENFPEGYRTEWRDSFGDFLAPYLAVMSSGRLLFFDYGFAGEEYYSPLRTRGTLRAFFRHAAVENVLENVGQQDITAHVDFSAFARCALELGAVVEVFEPQGFYITKAAVGMMDLLDNAQRVRNFQMLVHPAHLGHRFQAMELSWRERLSWKEGGVCGEVAMGRLFEI